MLEKIKNSVAKAARGNLVIGRKVNQSFFVGNAKITIVSLSSGQVRIAIDAPKSTVIKREELLTEFEQGMLLQQS